MIQLAHVWQVLYPVFVPLANPYGPGFDLFSCTLCFSVRLVMVRMRVSRLNPHQGAHGFPPIGPAFWVLIAHDDGWGAKDVDYFERIFCATLDDVRPFIFAGSTRVNPECLSTTRMKQSYFSPSHTTSVHGEDIQSDAVPSGIRYRGSSAFGAGVTVW